MSRCRHRWRPEMIAALLTVSRHLVCHVCECVIPLGRANDTPEALVELRAARLVTLDNRIDGRKTTEAEEVGAVRYLIDSIYTDTLPRGGDAGWLAAAIVMHEEGDR